MLEQYYVQSVTLLSTKRSAYGDIVPDPTGESQDIQCRFRVISNIVRVNNREEAHSEEAMVWLPPNTPVVKNDVLLYEGRYWLVVKIDEARRLGRNRIEFLKCWVTQHEVVS